MKTRSLAVFLLMVFVAAGGVLAKDKPKRPATAAQKLAKVIPSVKFAKVPLLKVLTHYSKISKLTFQVDWTGLEIAGIKKETPVTLKAYKLSVQKLLDLTLNSIARKGQPLSWYLSGGDVHVTTQMRAILRNRLYLPSVARGSGPARPPRGFRGVREFAFDQTPLRMAIEFLRDITGVNFHVNWRALEASGISDKTPVTLKAQGISVGHALDLMLDQLNVGRDRFASAYWIVDGGIVKISTGESFNRTTKVRIFEVGDLLMVVPSFKGPRMELSRSIGQSNNTSSNNRGLFGDDDDFDDDDDDDDDQESTREQRERMKETLIEIIKLSIGDDMWAPTGRGSIKFLRNKLIISQTPLGFKLLERAVRR